MLLYGAANAQSINLGYNALQAGITDQKDARIRAYTNISLSTQGIRVGYHGLNEAGRNYLFGRETFKIGIDKEPLDLIYTTRIAGTQLSNVKQVDEAVGIRLSIPQNTIMDYGFIDIVKHQEGQKKFETVAFAGKNISGVTLETTLALSGNGSKYLEMELIGPKIINVGDFNIKPYGRLEMPNIELNEKSTIIVGIHGML